VDFLSGSVVYNQETGKNDTLSGFKTIEFVNSNSDVPYDTYIAKKDLPAVDADQLFNLPQAKFIEPYVLETTMPFQNRWAKN
jgi:peptidyl-prolyl cis-trans isomerase D